MNKRKAVTREHLLGRQALLKLDLLDISRVFDVVGHRSTLRAIDAEMSMIEDELTLREMPTKPKTPKVVAPNDEWLLGMDELVNTRRDEDDS